MTPRQQLSGFRSRRLAAEILSANGAFLLLFWCRETSSNGLDKVLLPRHPVHHALENSCDPSVFFADGVCYRPPSVG